MLVLHRKVNKSIIVRDKETGEQLKIQLLEVRGRGARIGIQANDRFEILREEIIDRENQQDQDKSTSTEREETPVQAA